MLLALVLSPTLAHESRPIFTINDGYFNSKLQQLRFIYQVLFFQSVPTFAYNYFWARVLDLLQACQRRTGHVLLWKYAVSADGAHDCHEVLGAVEALDGYDWSLRNTQGYQRFGERQTLEKEVGPGVLDHNRLNFLHVWSARLIHCTDWTLNLALLLCTRMLVHMHRNWAWRFHIGRVDLLPLVKVLQYKFCIFLRSSDLHANLCLLRAHILADESLAEC